VRRIAKVVREQVGLYSTLTGAEPAAAPRETEAPANVLPLRARRAAGR
jgi:hypothetical protein